MLFKKKKSAAKEPEPTFVLSVPYSEHFRGYKRLSIDNYNDPEADKGLEAFKAIETVNQITFKEYKFPNVSPLIRVYADGNKLGTIWSTSKPELYELIKKRQCEKAHVAYNEIGNVFLFIKLK